MLYITYQCADKVRARALFSQPCLLRARSHNEGNTHILAPSPVEGYGSYPLSQDPSRFFSDLGRFGDLDWRELSDGSLEMAVIPSWKKNWIGRGGSVIRALQAHIDRRIALVDAVRVRTPQGSIKPIGRPDTWGTGECEAWIAPWNAGQEEKRK